MTNPIERARRAIARSPAHPPRHPQPAQLRVDALPTNSGRWSTWNGSTSATTSSRTSTPASPASRRCAIWTSATTSWWMWTSSPNSRSWPNSTRRRQSATSFRPRWPRSGRPSTSQTGILNFDALRTGQRGFGFSDGKPDFGLHSAPQVAATSSGGGRPSSPGVHHHETSFKHAGATRAQFRDADLRDPNSRRRTTRTASAPAPAQPAAPALPAADRSTQPATPPDAEAVDSAVFCPRQVAEQLPRQCFLYPPDASAAVGRPSPSGRRHGHPTRQLFPAAGHPRGARIDLHLEMPASP